MCVRLRSPGLKSDETEHSHLILLLAFLPLSTTSPTKLGRVLTVRALRSFQLIFSASSPVLRGAEKPGVRKVLY